MCPACQVCRPPPQDTTVLSFQEDGGGGTVREQDSKFRQRLNCLDKKPKTRTETSLGRVKIRNLGLKILDLSA